MMGPARHAIQIDPDIDQRIVEHTLFMAAQYTYGMDVPGDFIEFGTMTGTTAAVLALAIKSCDPLFPQFHRDLYLLDSFEGLPETTAPEDVNSPHVADGTWGPGTCIAMDAATLKKSIGRILPLDRVCVISGWFRDTARLLGSDKFACIHVDCDLYESTMDALDPLFVGGQVADGAVILFDDWNCNRADPRFGERAAWAELCRRYEIRFSDEGGYGMAGHKFICHGYRP